MVNDTVTGKFMNSFCIPIVPFPDGNGRISRLLSLLLLYRNGFDAGKYISFEEQINNRKGNYYDALQKSSRGWHENNQDYLHYVSFTIFPSLRGLSSKVCKLI